MKAEIIAVGTEVLMGDVINSNAAWVSRELAMLGIDVYHHITVGDNPERIQKVIAQSFERADVLIFTGGLGPTEDDLTVATIADYFHTPLVNDPDSEATIRNYFIARDQAMSKSNIKQALKPEGAQTIKNGMGTAPGIAWDVSDKVGKRACLLTFPGVPKELYHMWPEGREFLKNFQRAGGEQPMQLTSAFLHFFGIGESKLAEKLHDLMGQSNPTVAPYVGQAEVKICIVAKAPTQEEGRAMIEPLKREILNRCGEFYYGEDNTGKDINLERCVAELLTRQNRTVAVAESCTGGLVSSRLTDIPGSSSYTRLNVVTYSNDQKEKLLGVKSQTLQQFGAVSAECAAEMAEGIQNLSGCDIGLSLTGIAGPDGGSAEKPVGLVFIGLCGGDGKTETHRILVNKNYARTDIKHWFSQYGLNFLRRYLLSLETQGEPAAKKPAASGKKA